MADNPYDQFDSSNPYDQFDAKERPQPQGFVGPPVPERTTLQQIGRGLAIGGAGLYQGIANLVTSPIDLGITGINALTGSNISTTAQDREKALGAIGVPQDLSPGEQFASAVNKGVGGAAATLGLGGALAGGASPLSQAIGSAMTVQPTTQLASAATGAGSSDVARQMGAPGWGQWLAGMAGGMVPVLGNVALQRMAPNENLLGPDQFKAISRSQYQAADRAGEAIPSGEMAKLADDLQKAAHSSGMRPYNEGASLLGTANTVKQLAESGDVPFGELELLRRELKTNAGSLNGSVRRAAMEMTDKLDEFVGGLKGGPELEAARDFWSRGSKGEMITNMVQKAADSANNYTASGLENSIRAQFRNFVRNDNKMRMLSPDQQAAMRQVAQGTTGGNLMRFLGRFAARGPVSASADLFMGGGGLGSIGMATMGEAGRQGATAATNRNVQLAQEAMLQSATNPVARQPIQWPLYGGPAGIYGSQQ